MTSRKTDGENESNTLTAAPDVNAPPRFLYRTVVKVLVGSEEKGFDLHRELLCSTSKFFAAAFGGRFREAEVGVIKLPEQKVETFEYFVHWLYRSKLTGYFRAGTSPSIEELSTTAITKTNLFQTTVLLADLKAAGDSSNAAALAAFEDAPFHQVISLYILADALQICGLKDYIVSLLIKVYGIKPSCATRFWATARRPDPVPDPSLAINHAYERLPQSSLLKRVLV
ncbi:MAG: hypothetical protein M1830_003196, partial [Pleopsidium flavum]